MNKKTIYIGLAVIIIAILVLVINVSNTSNIATSFSNVLVEQNISLDSYSFTSLTLNASNLSYFFVVVELNKPANIYLLNKSAYTTWKASIGPNNTGLEEAIALEGRGAFAVYSNAINATVPPNIIPSATPLYIFNKTGYYQKGQYYLLVDNTNGSPSAASPVLARAVYIPPLTNSSVSSGEFSGLSTQIVQEVVYGAVFFILLVAGLVIVIYGFFKSPKAQAQNPQVYGKLPTNADQEYVDKLYKDIEKRKKAKKKKA